MLVPLRLRAVFTALVVTVALLGSTAPAAQAATAYTWTGDGGTTNFSDAGNWQDEAVPSAGDDLVFPVGVTGKTAVNDFPPGTAFGSITIEAAGYTLSGTALTVSGYLTTTYASGTSQIGNAVQLGSGSVDIGSGGSLTLAGVVSGTSGLTKAGAGKVVLTKANIYAGVTTVGDGTLAIANSSSLGNTSAGNGTDVSSGATLEIRGTINTGEPVTITGTGDGGVGSLYNSAGNNVVRSVTMTGDSTIGVASGTFMLIPSTLGESSGSFRMTKSGAGVLDVLATSSHTGGTTVAAGNLAVEGTVPGTISVAAGATLSGAGGNLGEVTSVGGTVTAGFSTSPFTADATSLTLDADSTFYAQLNGTAVGNGSTGHSRLIVAGDTTLAGATLTTTLGGGYTPAVGAVLTILTTGGTLTGTFNDLPEGAVLTTGGKEFRISYVGGDGNDITLTNVRPSTTSLTASPNPAAPGDEVTLTATVTPNDATGTVTFTDGMTILDTVAVGGGTAELATSDLGLGSHSITATYNGDATTAPSTSSATTQSIEDPAPDTTITSGPEDGSTGNTPDASFEFESPDANAVSFECSLDGDDFSTCSSPQAYTDLAGGSHTFEVRAVAAADQVDPTPASITWTVTGEFSVTGSVVVSGSPKVGQTLTATSTVETTPASTTTTGQWFRGDTAIDGATETTYELTNDDVSSVITYVQTDQLDDYMSYISTSNATDAITGGIFSVTGDVEVSGTAKVGQTLTATSTVETTPASTTTSGQWFRGDTAIDGATETTYELTNDDVSSVITYVQTDARDDYDSVLTTSNETGPITGGVITLAAPTITGDPVVDGELTATSGTVDPADATVVLTWNVGGIATSVTGDTYTVQPGDLGKTITVTAKATKTDYDDVSKTSDATVNVVKASFTTGPTATISGVVQVGETLTAGTGTVVPTPQYQYQWFAGGVAISGAKSKTYTLRLAQKGLPITVKVSAVRDGYVTATSTSAPTATVATNTAPGLTLGVSSDSVRRGDGVVLTWSTSEAGSLSASGAWKGAKGTSGEETVTPNTAGVATYYLTATNAAGSTTAQVTVDVGLPAATLKVKARGTVKVGRKITIKASRLDPGEAYTARIGGRKLASGIASASGTVKRSVRVPSSVKAGKRTIEVRGSLGDRTGTRHVKVTPRR